MRLSFTPPVFKPSRCLVLCPPPHLTLSLVFSPPSSPSTPQFRYNVTASLSRDAAHIFQVRAISFVTVGDLHECRQMTRRQSSREREVELERERGKARERERESSREREREVREQPPPTHTHTHACVFFFACPFRRHVGSLQSHPTTSLR